MPKEAKRATHGDLVIEDGSSRFEVEDSEGQSLGVRVGMVFGREGLDKTPGIWIEYQEKRLESKLQGPVLLSPKTWRRLNKRIEHGLKDWERRRPSWPTKIELTNQKSKKRKSRKGSKG